MNNRPEKKPRFVMDLAGSFFAVTILIFIAFYLIWTVSHGGAGSGRAGLAVGEVAPEITAAGWVNGEPPTDLTGKVVVVNAWATWCHLCREKAPELVEIYNQFADRDDVIFIGLTTNDASVMPAIKKFLEEPGITWPNGYGATESLQKFQADYIPSVWVISQSGKIAWNYDSPGDLESAIRKQL
ncbi:TlpA disulfide reductase family protein [uncultured Rubinisphaera sp.]|uniref:TlpA family protein disulfide reductase n=1 Tax=uncultured Rubinisphaera sp. TaxID=1678686 RepID=UPI0030DDCC29